MPSYLLEKNMLAFGWRKNPFGHFNLLWVGIFDFFASLLFETANYKE